MKKLKVVTIVGTRPEIIRLSALIPKLDQFTDHVLVHTGQNSDKNLNDVFFQDLSLRSPDYYLDVDTTSMGSVMGDTIKKSEEVFKKELPDAVMILGDTNSAIAAIVAERMHIPVYHMEAGNRSFDANVPEELNRRMVDHVASFNLPYNSHSKHNLLAEGIHPRRILVTGSPLKEVLERNKEGISQSKILKKLSLTPGDFFLASIHRQENVDSPERLRKVLNSIQRLSSAWEVPVLMSTHPRTRKRLETEGVAKVEGLIFHEPFGFNDYQWLQMNAKCVVSDSGTISEESSLLGFRAVTIRDSMERPEALEAGTVIQTGLDTANFLQSVELVLSQDLSQTTPEGYEVEDFSNRVLRFLFSTARLHRAWSGLHP